MTRVGHTVSTDIDIDMAIALGLPVTADCGAVFTPIVSGRTVHGFPDCLDCHPKPTRLRGSHRTPDRIRSAFPHYVYRCYDLRDQLLYVGCTYNPPARLRQHKADGKKWFPAVVRTRLVVYPDRRKALDMERLAIETEHPIHNRQFSLVSSKEPA